VTKVKEAAPPESPPLPEKGQNEDITPSSTRETDRGLRFLYKK